MSENIDPMWYNRRQSAIIMYSWVTTVRCPYPLMSLDNDDHSLDPSSRFVPHCGVCGAKQHRKTVDPVFPPKKGTFYIFLATI